MDSSDGVPVPSPEATVTPRASSQFFFLPVARVVCDSIRATDSAFPLPADTTLSAASQPLYRLNCALLI